MSDFYKAYSGRDVFVVTACSGKFSFANGAQAHRALRDITAKSRRKHKAKGNGGRAVYRCNVCHKWHIGGAK